ncbi:MAG: GNAT family N-acetyltransferase [Cyanobacteria bacterium P01_A01_bin.40]
MKNTIESIQLKSFDCFSQQSKICEPILRSLPQWFGIESALIQYIEDIEKLPTLIASVESKYVGFLSYKQHNEYAAELYVMGIISEYQRLGVGRGLVLHTESILRQ